jgi:E3 ubiquitin-protein ligase makorin
MADRRSAGVPVCRYYLQGYCAYGSRCHYDHPPKAANKAKKPEAPSRAHLAFPRPTASAAASASASASAASAAASWADAPPFIPGGGADSAPGFSYAARLAKGQAQQQSKSGMPSLSNMVSNRGSTQEAKALVDKFRRGEVQMCPIALATGCCLDASCKYLHGEPCPCCGRLALVPGDIRQNNQHVDECVAKLERQCQASLRSLSLCVSAFAFIHCAVWGWR